MASALDFTLITLRGSREKCGVAVPRSVCPPPQKLAGEQVLPSWGLEAAAVLRILLAAFRDFCDDAQFVKNVILIRQREGEKQKLAVMRVAQKLFQVLRKFVPPGEGVLGLLVNAPHQGEEAKEEQAGHAHRGCEDDGHDDPGGGRLVIDGLLTVGLTPFPGFVPIGKKSLNLNAISCPRLEISEDLKVILTSN